MTKALKSADGWHRVINKVWGTEETEYTKMLNETMRYGEDVITTPKGQISGYIFGTDEMFEGDEFYQIVLSGNTLYRAFYDTESVEDFGNIDYTKPYRIAPEDGFYVID